MTGEIMYELHHSGESAPQCVVCNHAAEHKCAMCGELICAEHARVCEFCEESQMPTLRYCDVHATEVEDRMYICVDHKPDFDAEMDAAALADVMAYEEVMA